MSDGQSDGPWSLTVWVELFLIHLKSLEAGSIACPDRDSVGNDHVYLSVRASIGRF